MTLHLRDHELLNDPQPFARLLEQGDVREELALGTTFGFTAFHGGHLEEMTDHVAREAAQLSGASYYGVIQPPNDQWHIPSHRIGPDQSQALEEFLDHVDIVISLHGFGRPDLWRTLLLGGRNRDLAARVAMELIPRLPHYEVMADLATIPKPLRGLHHKNPVNRPRHAGVQIELPPRVRGRSPIFWGPLEPGTIVPHLNALVEGLAAIASRWPADLSSVRAPDAQYSNENPSG
ncbi:MAG: hypothetical protein GY708_21855 [Actinomycetia bacterium]|nr:hypothetical protein [Actinomycetes bacterium]MCP4962824.1 hypothetical protein [Actinomycetes bacterium]